MFINKLKNRIKYIAENTLDMLRTDVHYICGYKEGRGQWEWFSHSPVKKNSNDTRMMQASLYGGFGLGCDAI